MIALLTVVSIMTLMFFVIVLLVMNNEASQHSIIEKLVDKLGSSNDMLFLAIEKQQAVSERQHALLEKIVDTENNFLETMSVHEPDKEEFEEDEEEVVTVAKEANGYPPAVTMFKKIEAVSSLVRSRLGQSPLVDEIERILSSNDNKTA
jgi:hypothetical protein